MSNYRRLISYIYAYEGGVKGRNAGYAKIEIRDVQCRVYVNVKKIYMGGNDMGVYLLAPGKEIKLGRMFLRGGNGEFRSNVNAENIEGSGCNIAQCYGLAIHDVESTWQTYTTIWEDAVTQAAEVTEAGQGKQESMEQSESVPQLESLQLSESAPQPESVPQTDSIEKAAGIKEAEEKKPDAQESPLPHVFVPAPLQESEKTDVVETSAEILLADVTSENARRRQQESRKNKISTAVSMLTREEPHLPVSDEIEKDLEKEEKKQKNNVPWKEEEKLPDDGLSVKAAPVQPLIQNQASLDELDKQEKDALYKDNRFWSYMQRRYARVLAFDYQYGCEILSIKPQDIGLLPRDIWIYGNNSFLLHGYYNFRHLILARLETPQETPRYLLGVPGHYFSNEKAMASMFGFPHFVLAKKQPEQDDRFGYWYTDIRL